MAVFIELNHFIVVHQRNQDMAIGQALDVCAVGTEQSANGERGQRLAVLVHANEFAAATANADLSAAQRASGDDAILKEICSPYLFLIAVHLKDSVARGDKGVAVGQTPCFQRKIRDVDAAEDVAVVIAFRHLAGTVLGHQDALFIENLGVHRIKQSLHLPARASERIEFEKTAAGAYTPAAHGGHANGQGV